MKRQNILYSAVMSALLSLVVTVSFSQNIQPIEGPGSHYKTFSTLNAQPNPERAWMDTIRFPWTEYSGFALASTLMRTVYLGSEDEAKLPTLVTFPANSSDQTRAELDYLLTLQSNRTKEEIARAEFIGNIGSWPTILNPTDTGYANNLAQLFYIATPVGKWFNYQNFPAAARLLLNCIQDIRVTEFRLKKQFRRARPYHLEPKLQPLARMSSPSFASGHSLWAFTQAFLFSEIIPDKRADFIKMAEEVRWSRELMGIHYPSDNEASRIIAWNLLKAWSKNPQFKIDLNNAKKEWTEKRLMSAK
ncbi:MAG TPA: phosphatase PAP2 family protein [Flavisolibacter sp.]|nr:phosphatase PAP2 family protein [Flavisolibacter sp.]